MFLQTKRLIIRELTLNDLDELSLLLGNQEVMHFSLTGPLSREQTKDYLEKRILSHYAQFGFGLWAVVHSKDQRLIGYAGLMMQSIDGEDLVELGYRLDPCYWGKGLASEAVAVISQYAFDQRHLDQIVSIIDPNNKRSIGVATRLGMHHWKDALFHNIPVQIYLLKKVIVSPVERSIQNILLDHQQLLTLVRRAFPHCKKLEDWKILSGGALNTIYQFQINDGTFVLRLYARDRAHCKTEKAIHQLIDTSVSTPKLIFADELHEPWAYSIFEFISGVHISEVSDSHRSSLSYELGHELAAIHAFTFPQAGLFGDGMNIGYPFERGSSPYYEKAFSVLSQEKNVRHRLGDKLTDATLAFMQKHKDFFPVVNDNICLTHSDFKPVNLLYDAQGKVFVLDWEFAHAGIGILDFAILLRHRNQFPLDLNALESGYTNSGGTLPDEWLRSAMVTDFVNIVTLMETPPERPQLFHQLKNAIQSTIDQWDSISTERK
jgi:RimJ/RimL family protein N-acetyltransferase/aminoglycoside phosphotransferase (APT) family kinase protein